MEYIAQGQTAGWQAKPPSAGHDRSIDPHLKTLIPQRTFDRLLRCSLHLRNPEPTRV
jgi:hypothetical protein